MIDLHLHTTASDGQCAPEELVTRARDAGITTLAVTDHDTMAGVAEAGALAARLGLTFVPGIEVTSVHNGHDVHMLGYWVDGDSPPLTALIAALRAARVERAREIARRLEQEGAPLDVDALVSSATARTGRSIARPQIAQALIQAGHVATVAEAFDRFLSEGRPAYVPHQGPSPHAAVEAINAAGGIASLAHPATSRADALLAPLAENGLTAVEAYHSSHDDAATAKYLALAGSLGLAVSGGSDFHGPTVRRAEFFGRVGLPDADFAQLMQRAGVAALASARPR